MQKALFGFAIAIILVLMTALVGPYFVDWGSYRTELEATASRLTGLNLRVAGAIDLHILPTPTLTLQDIALGRRGEPIRTRAQALRIEFSLPALFNGRLRAADLILQGPELAASLDASGRLTWTVPSIGFDPDAISIDHLEIEDGSAVLSDAASGSRVVLAGVAFAGQVSSLRGPVKGQGSFTLGGRQYPYRLSMGRAADDGTFKVRFSLDPSDDRPTADLDASIRLDGGIPHYDGTLQWAHAMGRGAAGKSPGGSSRDKGEGAAEPWRLSGHVRGDSAVAEIDQIELLYGADEQALRLRGDARLTLGAKPSLAATVAATQIDLGRILALPDAEAHRPLLAMKAIANSPIDVGRLPIPVQLGVDIDTVTLAGTPLQHFGAKLTSTDAGWSIDNLSFRAPGLTQVSISGTLGTTAGGASFDGATTIESSDPRALLGWLGDPGSAPLAVAGPLRLASKVALGGHKVTFNRLHVELDRMTVEGDAEYTQPLGDRPARLDATLHAPQFDLDRARALLGPALTDGSWDLPREGRLEIAIDRAFVGGIEADGVTVKLRGDPGGLDIEQVAVAAIGGAKLSVNGHIDTHEAKPQGAVSLDLATSDIDGLATFLGKFSEPAAERLRRVGARMRPVRLHGSLSLNEKHSQAAPVQLSLAGSAGLFRLKLQGGAAVASPIAFSDLFNVGGREISLDGRIDAGDGSALIDLLGLDRLIVTDKRSGWLAFNAHGRLDGEVAVDAKVAAGGLEASAIGTARPGIAGAHASAAAPAARLALSVTDANVQQLATFSAPPSAPWPHFALTAKADIADDALSLSGLDGSLAGSPIKGRLTVALAEPMRVDGELTVGTLDLPTMLAAAVGFPHPSQASAPWPSDPFEPGLLGKAVGQIRIGTGFLRLTPKLTSRGLHGVLKLDPSGLAVDDIDGALGGGRLTGSFKFERSRDGLAGHARLALAGADVAEVLPGDGRPPLSGRLSLDLDVAGSGRSPVALIGSLAGTGSFTLQDGGIVRLDPAAFASIMRSVDQGLASEATRISEPMDAALSKGSLPVALAKGTIAVNAGQFELADTTVNANGADLALTGGIDLTQNAISARLTLSGPPVGNAPAGRPEVTVGLKGPVTSPARQLDVGALATWLALRAADQKTKRLEALQAARDAEADQSDTGRTTNSPAPPIPSSVTSPPPRVRPRPSTADQGSAPIDLRPQGTPRAPRPDGRPLSAVPNGP